MAEYIKREYAYFAAVLIASSSVDHKITCDEVQKIMNSIPNADVVERKKGKWVKVFSHGWAAGWSCSECSEYSPCHYDFCPNCGADMR